MKIRSKRPQQIGKWTGSRLTTRCGAVLALAVSLMAGGCRPKGGRNVPAVDSLGAVILPNSTCVYHVGSTLYAIAPEGAALWQLQLPGDSPVIAPKAAAPNSTIYIRTGNAVHAVSHEGKLLWSHPLSQAPEELSVQTLAPVALADSGVALLESSSHLRCISVENMVRYTVGLPGGEPKGSLLAAGNGSVLITTTEGLYAVNPAGEIAWHHLPPRQ